MTQIRLRKYQRDLANLPPRELTERTFAILDVIERHRIIPTSLILRLVPGDGRNIYRHLQTAYHHGLVNRFAFPRAINFTEFYYYLDDRKTLSLLASQTGRALSSFDTAVVTNEQHQTQITPTPMTIYLYCDHCGKLLIEPPTYDRGEWFVSCLHCSAENLIEPTIAVAGWRRA